jgi:hypothetical protein
MKTANDNAGAIATCGRCGDPCRVAEAMDEDAKMLRLSKVPEGNCVNCAVAEWFYVTGLREAHPDLPAGLDAKPVQDQFAKIMKGQRADARPEEINWTGVAQ